MNGRSYHQHVFCGFLNQGRSRKVTLVMVMSEMVKKRMISIIIVVRMHMFGRPDPNIYKIGNLSEKYRKQPKKKFAT